MVILTGYLLNYFPITCYILLMSTMGMLFDFLLITKNQTI